ncbi:hypothetical protein [Ferruginibacter sp.]|uniref:hypothetical protein n=1 Tax=Ferruginibacter sp. TaxID=1940288 RepID=UPI002659D8DD|nr:hypothetical protein [Ferruginibacter sp.]
MMNETKITLSAKELELVCNTEWILTKHNIIQKVMVLFSQALAGMQQQTIEQKNNLPAAIFLKDPKISKGENYKSLPYVMLDYPRFFEKENTLAIRTFFWWGNFFSINLQLAGKYRTQAVPNLQENFLMLQQNNYWICINNKPWEHFFEEDNFLSIRQLTMDQFTTILNRESFIKISKKQSLQHWDTVLLFIEQSFEEMLKLLEN